MSDILIIENVNDLLFVDVNNSKNYGAGAYIFFEKNIPVYVGAAKDFRNRLCHLGSDLRENWSWGAAKKIIAKKNDLDILALSEKDKSDIHKTLLNWRVVRINIFDKSFRIAGYIKLERILGVIFQDSLLHGKHKAYRKSLDKELLNKFVRP